MADGMPSELLIGMRDSQFLLIRVLRRTHADRADYWDANWLDAKGQAQAGGWQGQFAGTLRTDEFARLHEQLSLLYDGARRSAEFSTMQGWLKLRFARDALGHLAVHCEIADGNQAENRHSFTLNLDQSFVRPMLLAIEGIVGQFPVIGRPD